MYSLKKYIQKFLILRVLLHVYISLFETHFHEACLCYISKTQHKCAYNTLYPFLFHLLHTERIQLKFLFPISSYTVRTHCSFYLNKAINTLCSIRIFSTTSNFNTGKNTNYIAIHAKNNVLLRRTC